MNGNEELAQYVEAKEEKKPVLDERFAKADKILLNLE